MLSKVRGIASQNTNLKDWSLKTGLGSKHGTFTACYTKSHTHQLQYLMIDQGHKAVLRPVKLSIDYRTRPIQYTEEWRDRLDQKADVDLDWEGSIAKNDTDYWFTDTDNAAFESTLGNVSLLPDYVAMEKEEPDSESPPQSDDRLDLDAYLPDDLKRSPDKAVNDTKLKPDPEGGLPDDKALTDMPVPHFFYVTEFKPETTLLEAEFPEIVTGYVKTENKWFDQASMTYNGVQESRQVVSVSVAVSIVADTKEIEASEKLVNPAEWDPIRNLSDNVRGPGESDMTATSVMPDDPAVKSAWRDWLGENALEVPKAPAGGWSPNNVKRAMSRRLDPSVTDVTGNSEVIYTPSESTWSERIQGEVDYPGLETRLRQLAINSEPISSRAINQTKTLDCTDPLCAGLIEFTEDTPSVNLLGDSHGSLIDELVSAGGSTPTRPGSAGNHGLGTVTDEEPIFLPPFIEDGGDDGKTIDTTIPSMSVRKFGGTLSLAQLDADPEKPSSVTPGAYLTETEHTDATLHMDTPLTLMIRKGDGNDV